MISIIMPAYNAGFYIHEAIESVLAQSISNWELIAINDGSTDNTLDILSQYNDSRIKIVTQNNMGVSAARNAGLSIMRGDYFCFLDADDVLPPNSLKARLEKFRNNPKLDFVDGCVDFFDKDLSYKLKRYKPTFYGQPLMHLMRLKGTCFLGLTWMVRNKFKGIKMKDGLSHAEDLLFYMNLAKDGGIYTYVNEPILYYRRHGSSAMTNADALFNGYKEVYREIEKWPQFKWNVKLIYQVKMRKFMFLEFLSKGEYVKALFCVFK